MSKHIGKVFAFEQNERGPQAHVEASVGGLEVALLQTRLPSDARVICFQPSDARTYAAMLLRGADEVDRMRAASFPKEYLAARVRSAEEALRSSARTQFECAKCRGVGCPECNFVGTYLKKEAHEHFDKFDDVADLERLGDREGSS